MLEKECCLPGDNGDTPANLLCELNGHLVPCTSCLYGKWVEDVCTGQSGVFVCLVLIIIFFLTPVLNSRGMKKLRYAIQKKYKNQAGMNLTPPPPSQNSHAVRWHCTAESERRVAEIKS